MIPLAFVLMSCIPVGAFGHGKCYPLERYDTMAQCEEHKAYLEQRWMEQVGTELPHPVHCEDHRT